MSNLRIKISINGIEVELEGDSKLVLSTLDDFRKNGVGKVATGSASQEAAEKIAPARRGSKAAPKAESIASEPRPRGRKPKATDETVVTEPKRRGRKPKVKDETVATEPKRRGRKPKVKDETVATEPKRRGRKPGPKKEKPATEPRKRGRPAKPAAEKKPTRKEESIDLTIPAADYDTALAKSLPRNESEWLALYARRSMEVWKKSEFGKNDLLNRYKDSGRDDKSKRSNFYNQFNAAMKKGLFAQGSSNESFVLTEAGNRLLDKVLRRTEGAKQKK